MINRSSSKVGLGLCFNFKVQTNIPPDKPVQIFNSLWKGKKEIFINSVECNSIDSFCTPYLYTLTKGAKKIIMKWSLKYQQFISILSILISLLAKTPNFHQHHKNSFAKFMLLFTQTIQLANLKAHALAWLNQASQPQQFNNLLSI